MAQPFTAQQRDAIRIKLLESACRHAIDDGPERTSLDTLTSEAGISKSSFYKFYDSKELLFLEIAARWEQQVLQKAVEALSRSDSGSKERAAAMVLTCFEEIHRLGIARFLREDLPQLAAIIPGEEAKAHYLASSRSIFEALCAAGIRFAAPDDVVLSVIQVLYLSILNIQDIGEAFFPALRVLVQSACDKLVV